MSSSGQGDRFWAGDLMRPHTPTRHRRTENPGVDRLDWVGGLFRFCVFAASGVSFVRNCLSIPKIWLVGTNFNPQKLHNSTHLPPLETLKSHPVHQNPTPSAITEKHFSPISPPKTYPQIPSTNHTIRFRRSKNDYSGILPLIR